MSDDFILSWKTSVSAPVRFKGRGHVAVVGKLAYFHQLYSLDKQIHQFDCETEKWSTLPNPPINLGFTITGIQDSHLTTIGSCGDSDGKLYTYVPESPDKKWVEKFPPVGRTIFEPFATSTRNKVLVIGRCLTADTMIGLVLNLKTMKWTRFNPYGWFSPNVYHSAFMLSKDDVIYHAAGYDFSGSSDAFFSCQAKKMLDRDAWKRHCSQPHLRQTMTNIQGHIFALGGSKRSSKPSAEAERLRGIYRYDAESNQWVEFGVMGVARCDCMVAVIDGKVIVVGDDDSGENTSVTDIATVTIH